jgi:hypothetical protein
VARGARDHQAGPALLCTSNGPRIATRTNSFWPA